MLGLELIVVLGVALLLGHRIDDTVLRQMQTALDIEEVRLRRLEHTD